MKKKRRGRREGERGRHWREQRLRVSGEASEWPQEKAHHLRGAPRCRGAALLPAPVRHSSPSRVGLAPASHSCNLRVRECVSLARPLCLCVRERGWGTEAGRRTGREGKKRREAIEHTHTHTRPNPPGASGLQLFHVGQQCWQGRRPGAAGSGSPACARGWRLAGAPLPAGAIVGLTGAERRAGTWSFLGAHFGLAERRNRATESERNHRRCALPPSSPLPRWWQSAATVRRRDPLYGKAPWGPPRRLAGSPASLSALAVAGSGQLARMPGAPRDPCLLPWLAPGEEWREAGTRVAGKEIQSGAPRLRRCSPWSPPRTGAWERG